MMWCDDKSVSGTDGQNRCDDFTLNNHNKSHWSSSTEHHLQQVRTVLWTYTKVMFSGSKVVLYVVAKMTWKYPGVFSEHIPDSYEWWCKQGIQRKLLETIPQNQIWISYT